MYDDLKNIVATTLETGRTYHTPQGNYPSITTILGKTSSNKIWLNAWKNRLIEKLGSEEAAIEEMRKISKYATDRGEKVHSYLEDYFNGVDVLEQISKDNSFYDISNMTLKMIKKIQESIEEVWAQEICVYSPTNKWAGRLDMVGVWKGKPAIIDFKTSKKIKKDKDIIDYKIQCTAYAEGHNELLNTNIKNFVIVIGVQDDICQIFEGSTIHVKPYLRNRLREYYENFHQ